MTNPIANWFFKGQNTRIPNESAASWKDLFVDDWKQRGKFGQGGSKGGWDITRGFRPGVSANEGGFMSGPTPLGRQTVLRAIPFLGSYIAGSQLFNQGQEGSLLDQATEAMPDVQIGSFGINNNPETDLGKRVWDFLSNKAAEIGTYKGGAEMGPIGTYEGGAEVKPLRIAGVPYTLPTQRSPYVINRSVHWMDSPIKRDYTEVELMNLMNSRYRV